MAARGIFYTKYHRGRAQQVIQRAQAHQISFCAAVCAYERLSLLRIIRHQYSLASVPISLPSQSLLKKLILPFDKKNVFQKKIKDHQRFFY